MLKYFNKLERHHKILFSLIIATAMILFWRGIWGLADALLIPENVVLSYTTSIAIGLVILLATDFLIKSFAK